MALKVRSLLTSLLLLLIVVVVLVVVVVVVVVVEINYSSDKTARTQSQALSKHLTVCLDLSLNKDDD